MNNFIQFCVELWIGSIAICILLFALNQSGWFSYSGRNDIDNQYKHWSSNPNFEEAQVLFCGNSQVRLLNDSILEESLGKNVFSLSCMGCRFEDHLEALRSKIDDNPPELIIIESHSLYGPVYNETRSRKVLKYLPTSLINFLSVRSEWDRVKYLVRDVIRERNLLEVSPSLLAEAILRPRETVWKNGFRKSHFRSITAAELEKYEHDWQPFPDTPIKQNVLDNLSGFLKECALQDVKVVLCESPYFHKHCVTQTLRHSGIEKLASEHEVPFFDLNEVDSLVTNHLYFQGTSFINQHTTALGANKVSELLSRWLSDLEWEN